MCVYNFFYEVTLDRTKILTELNKKQEGLPPISAVAPDQHEFWNKTKDSRLSWFMKLFGHKSFFCMFTILIAQKDPTASHAVSIVETSVFE